MIRLDQEAAGITYTVEGPEGTSFRDFHNLRHTVVSLLDESGATLKEAMELARHSDPPADGQGLRPKIAAPADRGDQETPDRGAGRLGLPPVCREPG
jgi:hypothetical protein